MPSVYLTGDVHGSAKMFSPKVFPLGSSLSADDYMLVAGDFGIFPLWPGESLETSRPRSPLRILLDAPWTTLFVDGNHENFEALLKLPVEERFGGPVHVVWPNKIYHLMRGYTYNLHGRRFLCMGGAESTDRSHRTEGVSWWPEEMPNEAELRRARRSMRRALLPRNNSLRDFGIQIWTSIQFKPTLDHFKPIDYIVTHAPPAAWTAAAKRRQPGEFGALLDNWYRYARERRIVGLRRWYCGHLHVNRTCGPVRCVFNQIIEVFSTEKAQRSCCASGTRSPAMSST